jgi:hypothetical protein
MPLYFSHQSGTALPAELVDFGVSFITSYLTEILNCFLSSKNKDNNAGLIVWLLQSNKGVYLSYLARERAQSRSYF